MILRKQVKNANKHTKKGMDMLANSINEVGYFEPMVAAADGEILSGSARFETSQRIMSGIDPIVVHSDGSRPIVVIRDDLLNANEDKAVRLSLLANRVGQENLSWDGQVVTDLLQRDRALIVDLFDNESLRLMTIGQTNIGRMFATQYDASAGIAPVSISDDLEPQEDSQSSIRPRPATDPAPQPVGVEKSYVPLQFTVTPEQRDYLYPRLGVIRAKLNLATNLDVIIYLVQQWQS